jgi:hypothetical protein
MRMVNAVALLALLPVTAAAQQQGALPMESVSVEDGGLAGAWKLRIPAGFRGSFFLLGSTQWSPMVDVFCRIEKGPTLSIHCPGLRLGGNLISRGAVTINGNRIRMVWGAGARFGLEGTLRPAAQFEGKFFIENFLSRSNAPEIATGSKLTLAANVPDLGGKSALLGRLLGEMAQGAVPTWSLDANATVRIPTPEMLQPLGAVQAILYLGEKNLPEEAPYSAYDVEFSNGNLICELRERGDAVNWFDCG